MGTSIDAFIEYDRALWFNPSASAMPPFSTVPESIDLTGFPLFRSGKDYRFLGAIQASEASPLQNRSTGYVDYLRPLVRRPRSTSINSSTQVRQVSGG